LKEIPMSNYNQSRPSSFNRQQAYWSPEVRGAVLKNRAVEIEAWANERKLNPEVLFGIAEATLRLGRVPDMGFYGLSPDDAYAYSAFLQDVILNVAEDEEEGNTLYEARDPVDVIKTLQTLIKFNNGVWKSDSQARFIMKEITSDPSASTAPDIKRWAAAALNRQGIRLNNKTHRIYVGAQSISRYGYKDPSKIRLTGWGFVVDSVGVIVRAKLKVNHKTTGEVFGTMLWNTADYTFDRADDVDSSHLSFSISREEKAEKDKLKAGIKAAKPIIAKIKTIPGWENQDIFKDFISQLEGGRLLSDGQLNVVNRSLPKEKIGLDWESWKKALKTVESAMLTKVLPVIAADLRSEGMGEDAAEMVALWKRWQKVKPTVTGKGKTLKELRDTTLLYTRGTAAYYFSEALRMVAPKIMSFPADGGDFPPGENMSFGPVVSVTEEAINKARSGKKLTKKHLGMIRLVKRLAKKLSGLKRVSEDGGDTSTLSEARKKKMSVEDAKRAIRPVLDRYSDITDPKWEKPYKGWDIQVEIRNGDLNSLRYEFDGGCDDDDEDEDCDDGNEQESAEWEIISQIERDLKKVLKGAKKVEMEYSEKGWGVIAIKLEDCESSIEEGLPGYANEILHQAERAGIATKRYHAKEFAFSADPRELEAWVADVKEQYPEADLKLNRKKKSVAILSLEDVDSDVSESMDRRMSGADRRRRLDPQDPGAMRDYMRSVSRSGKTLDLGKKVRERFGELAGMFSRNDPFNFWTESDTAEALLRQEIKRQKSNIIDASFSSGWGKGHPGFKNISSRSLDSYAGKIGIPADEDFSHKFVLGYHIVGMDRFEDKDGQPWRYELSADGVNGILSRTKGKWSVVTKRVDKFLAQGEQDEQDYDGYDRYEDKNMNESTMSGNMGAFVNNFNTIMNRTKKQLTDDEKTQKTKVAAPWAHQGEKSPERRPAGGPGSSGSAAFRKGAWTMDKLALGEAIRDASRSQMRDAKEGWEEEDDHQRQETLEELGFDPFLSEKSWNQLPHRVQKKIAMEFYD
jgi:hypothetical protein